MNAFFYIHVVWGHSIINSFIKFIIGYILYSIVIRLLQKPEQDKKSGPSYNYELISEDTLKEIYVVIYVTLNKAV